MRGAASWFAAFVGAAVASSACSPLPRSPPPVQLPLAALRGERPPPSLLAVESSTQALEEALRGDDCAVAQARIADAWRAWTRAEPAVRASGGSEPLARAAEAELTDLDADVAMCQRLAARTEAIDLLQRIAQLLGAYLGAAPPGVLRLDADLRRVRLDADEGDWSAASRDAGVAWETWSRRLGEQVGALGRMEPPDYDAQHLHEDVPAVLERLRAAVASRDETAVEAQVDLAFEQVSALRELFAERGDVSP